MSDQIGERLTVELERERRVRERAQLEAKRSAESQAHAERACAALDRALGQIASAIGEPGLEAEPKVLVGRVVELLTPRLQERSDRLELEVSSEMRVALSLIAYERKRQDARFGLASLAYERAAADPKHALAVATEEHGEVARAIIEDEGRGRILAEVVQSGAVYCAMAESYIRAGGEDLIAALISLRGDSDRQIEESVQ